MLKTSHIQEMKRRYLSMYIPAETVDDQFNEHCGVCDEQGIEEAVLADRDYKYDGKVIKISKKNFRKVHRDFKNSTKGQEMMMTYDDKYGTVSAPVEFTEEVEIDEASSKKARNKVADEIEAIADKGGAEAPTLFSLVSKLRKGTHSTTGLKLSKQVTSILKTNGIKEEVEIEESNELQAIMALDDVGIEATINKKDQVVVKKKDLKKAEKALKKSFKKGGAPELHGEEVKIGEKLEKESYGSFITAAAKAKKEGKKTFMMGGKKYPVTIKQKISAAYEEAEVEEAKLYAAKGTAYPATIDTLKMIVKDKQNQTIMFKDGKAMVDLFTASAMTQVYDALKKPEIKKSFEKMILDKAGFLKAQGFAMKMISGR